MTGPKRRWPVRLTLAVMALAGLGLAIALVVHEGADAVFGALASSWQGVLAVSLFHLLPMGFSALGWRALVDPAVPRGFLTLLWLRWIREGVDNLLPVAQIGGAVVGARLYAARGAGGSAAGAATIADMTMDTATQFVFTLMGIGLLAAGGDQAAALPWLIGGLGVLGFALALFVTAQHAGLLRVVETGLAWFVRRLAWAGADDWAGMHETLRRTYRDRRRLALSFVHHMTSWIAGAGEIWIALHAMGHGVSVYDALILESLIHAVRSAAFPVPAGLGVQEGGFMLLAALIGVGPEAGLALSLIRRVRDVLLGVPALIAWQMAEGRRLWGRRRPRALDGSRPDR
ncbi:MAG: TIGR00374 family protein [Alphaproteobacteria bacterium]|nr:TIGR00374 family protein [Alphaproteobacteria bacterium]